MREKDVDGESSPVRNVENREPAAVRSRYKYGRDEDHFGVAG